MNVVEPIADVATGALAARAVEPATGLDATGHTQERACLNCRTPLVGDYCHACGQRGHVHRTLAALGHDLLHGVLHFEGKIWRTLPMLAWRPGDLTRRYIAGERARFVSPLALFLFSVFLLATVLSSMPSAFMRGLTDGIIDVPAKMEKADQDLTAQLVRLRAERDTLLRAGKPTTEIDQRIGKVEEEQRSLARLRSDRPTVKFQADTTNSTNAWIDARWKAAKANPQLLIYKIKTSAYKYSWVLIPISVPALWLLFAFRRRYRLYDHAIFVIYSLSFMSLMAVLLSALAHVPGWSDPIVLLFVLIPPLHIYRQLRGAYELGWFSALWRAAILTQVAGLIMIFWMIGLMLLGAL